jgi:hypothetical protein
MIVAVVLGVPLVALMLTTHWHGQTAQGFTAAPAAYSVKDVGIALLDPASFLVPFELVSLLLLAVMIGAAYLAKSRKVASTTPSRPASPEAGVLVNTRAPDGSATAVTTGEVA